MKKMSGCVNRCIKLLFLFSLSLLFLLSNRRESITYAMDSKVFLTLATPEPIAKPTPVETAKPTPAATVKPTPAATVQLTPMATAKPTPAATVQPTPMVTVKPTPAAVVKPTVKPTAKGTPVASLPRQTTSTQQIFPKDSSHVSSDSVKTIVPATATSASPQEAGPPARMASLLGRTPVLSTLPLDVFQQDDSTLKVVLLLGVAASLLLITGVILWLLMKWLVNRQKLVSNVTGNSD